MPRETSAGSRPMSQKSKSNSREPSRPKSLQMTGDRQSNENSQERDAGSRFKNYLQAPASNTKTEKELKSEEFNRKKIISGGSSFRDYNAGAPQAEDETKEE